MKKQLSTIALVLVGATVALAAQKLFSISGAAAFEVSKASHGYEIVNTDTRFFQRGYSLKQRVYGPDLLLDFCRETNEKAYRHFFYGGAPGVPEALAAKLKCQFPLLEVAGTYSPPVRPLTPEEDAGIVDMINRAKADVLWVGLGCPKQECWMYEHREQLRVPVLVGVGQAFDLHAGRLKQAPAWMRGHGLEWLYRLLAEPRRLWRRYLIYNSEFVFSALLEFLGARKYD